MGPCDDLPAKPELFHWGRTIHAWREPVTQLCRDNVNSAIKEHGITCRVTSAAFGVNAPCACALNCVVWKSTDHALALHHKIAFVQVPKGLKESKHA
ncbi:hypothetical protein AVEN_193929-1 [Araneus ventricosus]|uniref:Uncharacterized protein n=1 Tax=Araneus ventricosus TaxID=182803 RepID=A0A4Y2JV43_ARAVE|nr:hypothetical protein AVEN_193929-1 [Araneus ventricosus]